MARSRESPGIVTEFQVTPIAAIRVNASRCSAAAERVVGRTRLAGGERDVDRGRIAPGGLGVSAQVVDHRGEVVERLRAGWCGRLSPAGAGAGNGFQPSPRSATRRRVRRTVAADPDRHVGRLAGSRSPRWRCTRDPANENWSLLHTPRIDLERLVEELVAPSKSTPRARYSLRR